MDCNLPKAERRAVEKHRNLLSVKRGSEVSSADAEADWLEHCSQEWRRRRQALMLAVQREEMLRHKWIESEKAHHDMGKQAIMDWIMSHAAAWRSWYDANEEQLLEQHEL